MYKTLLSKESEEVIHLKTRVNGLEAQLSEKTDTNIALCIKLGAKESFIRDLE